MHAHTTNYFNTFICTADDCPVGQGAVPEKPESVVGMQFARISANPYRYTSDELLFEVFAARKGLGPEEFEAERRQFFSKGQPCMRASPLLKRYGWGVHYDAEGRMALFGLDSTAYLNFSRQPSLKVLKAMKSSK